MIRNIIRHWLPLVAVITALCALAYVVSQQSLRLSGNDPQIQMAQDAAARLTAGEPVAGVAPTGTLDVGRSLAPFTIVYNDQGNVLEATGLLHGQPPALPSECSTACARAARIEFPGSRSRACVLPLYWSAFPAHSPVSCWWPARCVRLNNGLMSSDGSPRLPGWRLWCSV